MSTSPTPTPPCLGEREAVARTLRSELIARHDYDSVMRPHSWIDGFVEASDAIIAEHIEPLRTENETLRAALAQALRFVDRAAGQGLCFTEGDHGEPATDAADVCCAVARTLGIDLDSDEFRALTTEHPHGD